ncbi:pentatricopeptide repeat-containing protein At3g04760, chloroplastic-like [Pistacia vera]|uniref:pentatricopeptide repeat-containing protein At3g04760, chloroplastic-like n=1 Tax=Pistacia vera TaxID=55513 RepID=UPI00126300E6|nr:pentatricopeptide repeat-containing protein At3g04760, chloroplastic-like [Pistacia vera]
MASKTLLRRCSSSSETVTKTKISSLFTKPGKVTTTKPPDSVHNVEELARLDKFLQKDCKEASLMGCKNGMLEIVLELFHKLPQKGLMPDVVTYSILIRGFCKEGKLEKAYDLLSDMESNGCTPNVGSFILLCEVEFVMVCCFWEDFEVGFNPDAVTFTSLIKGLLWRIWIRRLRGCARKWLCWARLDVIMYVTLHSRICRTSNTSGAL